MPLNQRTGAVVHPAVAADLVNGHLWSVADPARDRLLGLFGAALIAEMTATWDVARVGTALSDQPVVADTLHQQPRRNVVREGNYDYPLLALYRVDKGEWSNYTLRLRKLTQNWRLDYIIGPLLLEDERKLAGALPWVPKIIDAVIESRGHSSYESGALQFEPTTGGLASLELTGSEEGLAEWGEGDGKVEFYAASMTLRSVEIEDPEGGADSTDPADYEGMTHTMGLGGSEPEELF
jgi:hypothetical protein